MIWHTHASSKMTMIPKGKIRGHLQVRPENLKALQYAMWTDVQQDGGTGRRAPCPDRNPRQRPHHWLRNSSRAKKMGGLWYPPPCYPLEGGPVVTGCMRLKGYAESLDMQALAYVREGDPERSRKTSWV